MRFELPPDKHAMTNEQLLGDLRKCAREVAPAPLSKERYDSIGIFSAAGIQKRFGSWNKAISAAGLQTSLLSRFDGGDEEYFELIEAAWQKFGRPPKKAEIRRPEFPVGGYSTARRFGFWRAALEAFVHQAERIPEGGTEIGGDVSSPPLSNEAKASIHRTNHNIGWRLRFLALRRDGFRCRLCGASPAITPGVLLQVDHIEPWANGGETMLENLQSTCDRCNGGKSALPLHEGVQTQGH
jgi:hypothetical protein